MNPQGNANAPVWMVIDEPYENDYNDGVVFSSAYGHVFKNCWRECGGTTSDIFIVSLRDGRNQYPIEIDFKANLQILEYYKPPIICPLGEVATALFVPETRRTGKSKSSMEKWAGSLLTSPYVSFPHYCIPLLAPNKVVEQWEYRFVYVNIDMAHVLEELQFFRANARHRPLPSYNMTIAPSFTDLKDILYGFYKADILGSDIETIRPLRTSTRFKGHPGYPYLLALADKPDRGVSFSLWDYTPGETVTLLRILDDLLYEVPQVGQNYFRFDSHFLEALGLRVNLSISQDTLFRHHILWPELPHKLQFQTKHYTRQPYYKDEGKFGSPKNKIPWMKYNVMDACVTKEIYLQQELEFADRPYLK